MTMFWLHNRLHIIVNIFPGVRFYMLHSSEEQQHTTEL